jgi:phage tail sheath gpL-like
MALQIPIVGVGADFRVPGAYAEVIFGQGPASAAAGTREVVIAMPMLSTGTWTAATLYAIGSEKDAETGAGSGSPLHRAARIFLQANRNAKLWGLPVAETVTGSPAAATNTLTIATTSTGVGTLTVTIAGEECSYTFPNASTASVIGDGIVAAIKGKTWLPVTASNSSGTVTITAKLKGISQGTATVPVIRCRVSITSGIGTTASLAGAFLGAAVAGAEGSTTEAANLATALLAIASTRKYYIVTSANDATSLGNLKTHISTKSEPRQGLRSVGIGALVHGLAACSTISNTLNYERLQLAWQPNGEWDCASIAANVAAIRQKYEQIDSAFNFDSYRGPDWLVPPTFLTSDWPNTDDQNDAINDGLTPISTNGSGSRLVLSATTRSKNSGGTVDDFRAAETHRVSVADEFTDEELVDYALNYSGKKLAPDQLLSDGTVNPNQKEIRNVVKPSSFKAHIGKRMDDFEAAGKTQQSASSKASIRVVKTGSRLEVGFDLVSIDLLHIATYRVAESSSG